MTREQFIQDNLHNFSLYGKACEKFGNATREEVLGKWYDIIGKYKHIVLLIEDSGAGKDAWSKYFEVANKPIQVISPTYFNKKDKQYLGNAAILRVLNKLTDTDTLYLILPDRADINMSRDVLSLFEKIHERIKDCPNKILVKSYICFESVFFVSETFAKLSEVKDDLKFKALRHDILNNEKSYEYKDSLEEECFYRLNSICKSNMYITKANISDCYTCIKWICKYDFKNILESVFNEYLLFNTELGGYLC